MWAPGSGGLRWAPVWRMACAPVGWAWYALRFLLGGAAGGLPMAWAHAGVCVPDSRSLWLKELDARGFQCQVRPGSPGTWRGPTGRC
eukprot:6670494-Alexandrium_andersonii.AAC.1